MNDASDKAAYNNILLSYQYEFITRLRPEIIGFGEMFEAMTVGMIMS